ncbi:MAG: hypothetical protein OEZ36_01240 [Spirochaetota bacterium]|nr:hypothetical protein [Spirochaetota bacterium]
MRLSICLSLLCLSGLLISACETSDAREKSSGKPKTSPIIGSWKISETPCKALSFIAKNSVLTFSGKDVAILKSGVTKDSRVIASGKWVYLQTSHKPILNLRFTQIHGKKSLNNTQPFISGYLDFTGSKSRFSVEFYCQEFQFLCDAPRTKPIYLKGEKISLSH